MNSAAISLDPSLVDATRRLRRSRAPVPLEPLLGRLQKFTGYGSRLFALIKRIVLLVLQRVARVFDVRLEHQGLETDQGPVDAGFTGDPDFPDRPAAAAAQAVEEVSDFVDQVLNDGDKAAGRRVAQVLKGGGADAFLALWLDRLASEMKVARSSIDQKEGDLAEGLAGVSARLGVRAESLRQMLADGADQAKALVPSSTDPELNALASQVRALEEIKQRLLKLRSSFVDHCVAARQLDPDGELSAIANAKLTALGDSSLEEAVETASVHDQSSDSNTVHAIESTLNSPKTDAGEISKVISQMPSVAPAAPAKVGRRAFYAPAGGSELFPNEPAGAADDLNDEPRHPRER
ncbi:hypothetical protein [Ramlibacter sp. AN1133]|uniref:hypothetical protein n=1 Tax=Ramlibacter sp. AN1133 TaxID=3133429 RepID=UPI0030C20583